MHLLHEPAPGKRSRYYHSQIDMELFSKKLLNVLKFIGADPDDSSKDFNNPYIQQLQFSINAIKRDREMGKRYMLLEELLMRERQISMELGKAKGKAESIISILSTKASLTKELSNYIMNETNLETLDNWLILAVSANSIEQFMDNIHFII